MYSGEMTSSETMFISSLMSVFELVELLLGGRDTRSGWLTYGYDVVDSTLKH
jgi:hypothetical protein